MTKVFISYSHDSDAHRAFVRDLSDRLRREGLDCQIDQYINGFPPEGWQRWMENQLEVADFVLLVCTEVYLRRYRGQETQGGKGVTFEGVVISQTLYDHYYHNTKFIPVIPSQGDFDHVPIALKAYSTYMLPRDYDTLYRMLTRQAEYLAPVIGTLRSLPTAQIPSRIHSDRLPTVKGGFFGRIAELQLLNDAWAGNGTRIIQFIAPGGTGKTKLLRHWLDHTKGIDALLVWSFYAQGASEDKQISATPFFSHVFGVLKSDKTQFNTEEEKGEHLAHLLRQRRCLLVLDGLEPLQHAGRGMRGELKDRAIRQLLKSLAGEHNSLCIITTRLAVHELSDRAHVVSHNLQNLAPQDGVSLLKSWEVYGSETELEKAVHEYGCHALALHLLGNALHTYLDGDIRKRDTLDELLGDYDAIERHAFRVMQAYSRWLEGTPDLQLLHLLGLFDHPIETEVLQVLWQAQIPDLTAGIPEKAWKVTIRDLREKHRMLSAHEGHPDLLDCHPLIREYFGKQLQSQHPAAWQQAHARLYDYYKALPEKEFPDTLEEMQPLFRAVAHGCAAGLHQEASGRIHWMRIYRGEKSYILRTLGASSDDLAVIANFFDKPWSIPSSNLHEELQAIYLNRAAFQLSATGRIREALEPAEAATKIFFSRKSWQQVAREMGNRSEREMALGNFSAALDIAKIGVDYAKKSSDKVEEIFAITTYADVLHQSGHTETPLKLFIEAEKIQQRINIADKFLFGLQGFQYCDLLLRINKKAEVLERAKFTIKIARKNKFLLDIALDQLTLGRSYLFRGNFTKALDWLNRATTKFHEAECQAYTPLGLLARAALYRTTDDFTRARQDLQEVFDIAEPSGMRLHLTDYHLEMARLLLAEGRDGGSSNKVADHITAAARLIQETGYHRRDAELVELQTLLIGYPSMLQTDQ
ncbi:SEFIR domain-containing protein [uncultured Thiothrix sp.]|uniref:SEFIR domain-containing protein n=1 Tax=uncultured Thiothrix sp. TaxID=223185 RepID=UPI002634C2C6|nr:SEFIR domain-containing protein [uncultured Thiothrix sp.]HMT92491.1 TIR domain-containing protein [Thiolinea sp.]